MCGIAGQSSKQIDSHDNAYYQSTLQRIIHRGPDDSGIFRDENQCVGLIHARLSILDTSPLGHQPMLNDDETVVIVFNGEIYNFKELRSELILLGYEFKGQSDTEVLLKLYLSACASNSDLSTMLKKLNGIFAFAIWDRRVGSLLLARDGLGVKPLYYSTSDEGFFFSSEIKSLTVKDREIDFASLNRYLTYLWCPGEGTPFLNVKKLLPGEAMWVKNGVIRERFTWYEHPIAVPRLNRSKDKHNLPSTYYIDGTKSHLRQAVHRQLVSDVPVGAFLSGGLDSSSIVAFAKEKIEDIHCFTIEASGFEKEGATNDLPYARRVAKHLNIDLSVVRVDAAQMAIDLPDMIAQLDEPLADPAPLNVLYISRLAKENGIKVLLSGAGGDDLFTGYRRHRALASERYWSWLPSKLLGGFEHFADGLDQRNPFNRRLRKFSDGITLRDDARLVNYFRWIKRSDLESLYTNDFQNAIFNSNAEDPMLRFLSDLPPDTSRLERMLALEQRFFLTDHNLLYTDKMSMAVGVEVRVPFLDNDIVEFASTIPQKYKQRGSEGKWVLKKAMESILPNDVIYRPKSGFGVPLRTWMSVDLRETVNDVLSDSSLSKRGIFKSGPVQALIKANNEGRIDASYTIFSLMCIELWCRRFLDNKQ